MTKEILLLVDALSREKNVPKDIVFLALEMALASATKKRFKDEVKEVVVGQECGMAFENYQDIRAGDIIECFRVEKVQRKLLGLSEDASWWPRARAGGTRIERRHGSQHPPLLPAR